MKIDNRNPYYGIEAPDVVTTLLWSAIALIAIGFAVSLLPLRLFWLFGVGWFLVVLGALPLTLAIAMLTYAGMGKFAIRDRMLSAIKWRGDETVLDVGTGRGLLAIGAARRLRTGKATGIDIWKTSGPSGNSQERALTNAAIERVSGRIEFKTGDARALDFPDGTFDAVFSLLCLHKIEDGAGRERACREIARVTKPGGTVVIGDNVSGDGYGSALAKAGLTVKKARSEFRLARGPMWIVTATKPQTGQTEL